MLESIEGKRGLPRHKPPFAAEVGLSETDLDQQRGNAFLGTRRSGKGARWFSGHGRNGRKGLRTFSVSGRVPEPGVKIAGAGITIRELISEYCGGMAEGHTFKGYLPGGIRRNFTCRKRRYSSGFRNPGRTRLHIGSAAVVVLSDHDSIADAALNLMRFFEDESCGQYTLPRRMRESG